MKRIFKILAGMCILLCLFCGCPTGETVGTVETPEIDGSQEKENENENEKENEDLDKPGNENQLVELLINELRTEWSSSAARAEYIEFKITSDGNMGGLKVFAASNNKNAMIFEFAPVQVKAGDYIVLHLRTLDAACRDEYGSRLDESGGMDSCPTARDFWIPGSNKLLRKTDAVYVLDKDDRVLDAVMISESPDASWDRTYLAEAAEFLFNEGAWKSPSGEICTPADAVSSANTGTAVTRSISRDETVENSKTAADWYVTANAGITPGLPNNPKRYQ
jgi:hypothetical protein